MQNEDVMESLRCDLSYLYCLLNYALDVVVLFIFDSNDSLNKAVSLVNGTWCLMPVADYDHLMISHIYVSHGTDHNSAG